MRRPAAAAVSLAALLGAASVASGHTTMVSSNPARDARVTAMPKVLTLTFSGVVGRIERVSVTRAGRQYAVRSRLAPRNARQVRTTLRKGGAGQYTVTWRVLAVDGHRLSGTFRFRVTPRT